MDACNNLTYGGYSDWILPAKEVLNTMFIHKNEIGGFSSAWYWSSTEFGSSSAWEQEFYNGNQNTSHKGDTDHVRCVRREN